MRVVLLSVLSSQDFVQINLLLVSNALAWPLIAYWRSPSDVLSCLIGSCWSPLCCIEKRLSVLQDVFFELWLCSFVASFVRWVFTLESVDWSMCRNKLLISLHQLFFCNFCLFSLCKRAWWSMRRTVIQGAGRSEDIRVCVSACRLCWEMPDSIGLFPDLNPLPRVEIGAYFQKLLNRQSRNWSFCLNCDVKAGGSKNDESNPCPCCDERSSFQAESPDHYSPLI